MIYEIKVLNFWGASLRNCINCVHCDDHFFISFRQFTYDRHILNSMHEGDGFLAKTHGKTLFLCQNDQSGHGPARSEF